MKKSLYVLASLFALLQFSAVAQEDGEKKRIEGSGNIITKDIPVQSFDELVSSGVFSVQLTQGSKEALKVEGDDNLLELFEVANQGSKLSVKMKKDVNFNSKSKLKVYITFTKLKRMELAIVGGLSSKSNLNFDELTIDNKSVGSLDLDVTAKTLNIDNKSVGNMKLNGKAENAVIKNKGVGSLDAGDLVVQKMNIENTGVGSAEVNAEKELTVKDSFIGKVRNKGAATVKRLGKTSI